MMNRSIGNLRAIFAMVLMPSLAMGFVNMNFESAVVVPTSPGFGFLDWNVAAPGWSHSSGSDTGTLYYGQVHAGATQWYMLVDRDIGSNSPFGLGPGADQPLADRFSLQMESGYQDLTLNSPWINAFISQIGTIPADALSLRLLSSGNLSVFINGTPITMQSLGGGVYAGDVSGYAGMNVELKIANNALSGQFANGRTTVDNIAFSTAAAPEPSRCVLLVAGMMGLGRRRRVR